MHLTSEQLANDETTSPSQLCQLASESLAIAIAANPNTSIRLFKRLAQQKIGNYSSGARVVVELMSLNLDKAYMLLSLDTSYLKPASFIRLLALCNPLAPSSFLAGNFRSSYWLDRYAIAKNPNTLSHIRQRLISFHKNLDTNITLCRDRTFGTSLQDLYVSRLT